MKWFCVWMNFLLWTVSRFFLCTTIDNTIQKSFYEIKFSILCTPICMVCFSIIFLFGFCCGRASWCHMLFCTLLRFAKVSNTNFGNTTSTRLVTKSQQRWIAHCNEHSYPTFSRNFNNPPHATLYGVQWLHGVLYCWA